MRCSPLEFPTKRREHRQAEGRILRRGIRTRSSPAPCRSTRRYKARRTCSTVQLPAARLGRKPPPVNLDLRSVDEVGVVGCEKHGGAGDVLWLASTPDGDGSLLDHVTILIGGGMSDGNGHVIRNLPLVVAGGGSGQLQGGDHIRYPEGTPLANLHVSLLDKLGAPVEFFGNSTGSVDLDQLAGI